jgi:DNA-directed RNA polymerase specialized sigma24 family protein
MTSGYRAVTPGRGEVLGALGGLDAGDREVIRRLHVLRSSPAETATQLGIPVEEVHLRAYRAAKELCTRVRERTSV